MIFRRLTSFFGSSLGSPVSARVLEYAVRKCAAFFIIPTDSIHVEMFVPSLKGLCQLLSRYIGSTF